MEETASSLLRKSTMAGRAAAVLACMAAVACCAVMLMQQTHKPSTTSLLQYPGGPGQWARSHEWVALSVDPALLPNAAPVEGKFCCARVPLPCCTSQACCDAWETEGLSTSSAPVALKPDGTALMLSDMGPEEQGSVLARASNYMRRYMFAPQIRKSLTQMRQLP